MPSFSRDGIDLYYELHGEGYPVLLFAPGGMRSAIKFWYGSPFNPIETLSSDFQVIAMDQRNAGLSRAPISASDDWSTYTQDHIALLDHLGIEDCHVMGGCIGGSFSYSLMQSQPERIKAAVIQQTIGFDNNRDTFYDMFDGWANTLEPKPLEKVLTQFRSNMYDKHFLFSVDEAFVEQCSTPQLVLLGNDIFHPESISRAIASLAPNAHLIEDWKSEAEIPNTIRSVTEFLLAHTPKRA